LNFGLEIIVIIIVFFAITILNDNFNSPYYYIDFFYSLKIQIFKTKNWRRKKLKLKFFSV
jgi:hypothetical protein